MRKADFKARIKKIEIANRTLADGWAQAIRVLLDDIELTNDNLLELKQFKPNEPVLVQITPVQVSLTESTSDSKVQAGEQTAQDDEEDSLFDLIEGDTEDLPPGTVEREWKF